MPVRELAEKVICQMIEDLWDEEHRAESLEFFGGTEFRDLARISGMSTKDMINMLGMINGAIRYDAVSSGNIDPLHAGRAITSPQALPVPLLHK